MTLPATAVSSVRPVLLPTPARGTDLSLRVSAPITGAELPVLLFSHGFGRSMDDYAPLVDQWTAHGFVVVQPTHLDSHSLALPPDDPRTPDIWRYRIQDLVQTLDELPTVLAAIPGLPERSDLNRIAVSGHSWGATSASALLGARVIGADGRPGADGRDARVRAGVLLALAGHGQEDLTPFAAENFAFMSPEFSRMTTPALLVAGGADQSLLSTRGPDWWSDGFEQSPAPKSLLTLPGAEHSLGGVSGYHSSETTDENPDRVALIGRLSIAYLQDALDLDHSGWAEVRARFAEPQLEADLRSK